MKQTRVIGSYFLAFWFGILSINAPNAAAASAEEAKDSQVQEEVVVTAPLASNPLMVETKPKSPRQPVPPNDGGGYLKNIPGFSATRKGGTGGDPTFRSLGGSRLNVLLDGTYLFGGCGGRMDPPTAYIFPESYDKITVLKGPESVLYGGGNIAGTVLFERITPRFEKPGNRVNTSLLVGSFGRHDELIDITGGDEKAFVRFIRTRSTSDDYEDGNGNKIHSFYTRNSLSTILGLTPDDSTRYEFQLDASTAQAAYADRGMDGSKFDRTDYSFTFDKKNLSPLLTNINFKIYHNYIDHVMDNYSLRPLSKNAMAMATNPNRNTSGARLAADLRFNAATTSTIGIDYQENTHKVKGSIQSTNFENLGIFADIHHNLDNQSRLIGGLRTDFQDVKKQTAAANQTDKNTTYGAFLRYEHDLKNQPITTFFGIGHAERPADYWERNRVFNLKPEKNTQLDTGLSYHKGKLSSNLSLFYSKINDYILVNWASSAAANIDATLYGGEADALYKLNDTWSLTATLAYTHGYDDTYQRALPQVPPLELTLGLKYAKDKLNAGLLWRGVKAKTSFDKGNGNVIAQDLGPSAGFGILSANLTYRPTKSVQISAGVDNLFDKNYAEFVSKNGTAISTLGIPATFRINEPGRTFWLKTSYSF